MSEQVPENPHQAVQPGAAQQQEPVDTPQPSEVPQETAPSDDEPTYAMRLVKRETGETHWNTAKGVWELVTHGETGEPVAEYVLLAAIDGVDVPLARYNAGRIETIVRAQQQAQQTSGA